jgi:hypothetical protein
MLLHIIIEVVLGVAMLFAGQTVWQLRKRDRFMRQAIQTPAFLESLISRDSLASPPTRVLAFVQQQGQLGYVLNMKCLMDADKISQRRATILFALAVAAILVGSYFLGLVYLAINVALFFLTATIPIAPSAQSNAAEHIFTTGLLLHRWRLHDAKECDEFVERASSIRLLYDVVRKIQ